MKIANIILVLIFILFAGWQYNDPDPHVWMPIYFYCAAMCAMIAMGKPNKMAILVGLIPIGIFMVTYIPDFINWIQMGMPSVVETMKAEKPFVELTREFGGLVICFGVLLWQYLTVKN
jgi:hypothetical membrane protein